MSCKQLNFRSVSMLRDLPFRNFIGFCICLDLVETKRFIASQRCGQQAKSLGQSVNLLTNLIVG